MARRPGYRQRPSSSLAAGYRRLISRICFTCLSCVDAMACLVDGFVTGQSSPRAHLGRRVGLISWRMADVGWSAASRRLRALGAGRRRMIAGLASPGRWPALSSVTRASGSFPMAESRLVCAAYVEAGYQARRLSASRKPLQRLMHKCRSTGADGFHVDVFRSHVNTSVAQWHCLWAIASAWLRHDFIGRYRQSSSPQPLLPLSPHHGGLVVLIGFTLLDARRP